VLRQFAHAAKVATIDYRLKRPLKSTKNHFLRGESLQILPQSSNSSAALGNVLMFARYENTGIKVLMANSGKLVDMDSYTVNDHVEATRSAFAKTWGRFHDRMTHVVQQSVAGDVRPASQSSRT
jgi:hypothetical protein